MQIEMQLAFAINRFNARYAECLDQREFGNWPKFFTPKARYQVQGRENHARNLPLCLMDLESQAMMQDRVYGITQTIYHAPYYTRHIIGHALVTDATSAECKATTNFCVIRIKPGAAGHGVSEVYAAGRYIDSFDRPGDAPLLTHRMCVLDSENVLNSMIYPI